MADTPTLSISPEKLGFVIRLKRQFDAKDVVTDPDSGSNPTDDNELAVLEDHANDPVVSELTSFIDDLNVDEQIDLVALSWLGRGDDTLDGWDDLRARAADAHNAHTAEYLIGTPLLGDFLEEAAAQLGYSFEDLE